MRLLEVLNMLYDIPVDTEDFDKALSERKLIGEKVDDSPEIKALLPQLEKAYELRLQAAETEGDTPDDLRNGRHALERNGKRHRESIVISWFSRVPYSPIAEKGDSLSP